MIIGLLFSPPHKLAGRDPGLTWDTPASSRSFFVRICIRLWWLSLRVVWKERIG